MSQETDEQVCARVKKAIAAHGLSRFECYELFLADNRTFDPYWDGGWEAICKNTVDKLSFGIDAMIRVGRAHPGTTTTDEIKMVDELAFQLDRSAQGVFNSLKTPSM